MARKVGSGIAVFAVYDLISDFLHLGFREEPLRLIEDALTYGLFMDVVIFITKGNLFSVLYDDKYKQNLSAIVEGLQQGFAFSFVHPFFTYGFMAPLIFGFTPNLEMVLYLFVTYIAGDAVISTISGLLVLRVLMVVAV
ncbi:MAG: hypothetical protein RXR08_09350 [Sulfolobaceae archaeon]